MVVLMDRAVDGEGEGAGLSGRAGRKGHVKDLVSCAVIYAIFLPFGWLILTRDAQAFFYVFLLFSIIAVWYGGLLLSTLPVSYLYDTFVPQLWRDARERGERVLIWQDKQTSRTVLLLGIVLPTVGILLQIAVLLVAVIYGVDGVPILITFFIVASVCYSSASPLGSLVEYLENDALSLADDEEDIEEHGPSSV